MPRRQAVVPQALRKETRIGERVGPGQDVVRWCGGEECRRPRGAAQARDQLPGQILLRAQGPETGPRPVSGASRFRADEVRGHPDPGRGDQYVDGQVVAVQPPAPRFVTARVAEQPHPVAVRPRMPRPGARVPLHLDRPAHQLRSRRAVRRGQERVDHLALPAVETFGGKAGARARQIRPLAQLGRVQTVGPGTQLTYLLRLQDGEKGTRRLPHPGGDALRRNPAHASPPADGHRAGHGVHSAR